MSSIEVGAVVTAIIGILWIALSVIYHTDIVDTIDNVTLGVAITVAGLLGGIAARWWENRQ